MRSEELWYNGRGVDTIIMTTAATMLNLHSVFSKGTIEFRLFNSTLHAGEVKSYIQLCLAISHQALVQRGASRAKTNPENEKYTFRTWLLRLDDRGRIQNRTATPAEKLGGNIAWRDPAQAEAQKARLAAKRLEEQQAALPESEPAAPSDEQEQDTPAFTMSMG